MSAGLAAQALKLGAPVLAAKLLLAPTTAADRHLRYRLRQGALKWTAPLPFTSKQRAALERLTGEEIRLLDEPAGVHVLAAHRSRDRFIGTVQLLAVQSGRHDKLDDFGRGCYHGELATIAWLYRRSPQLARFSHRLAYTPQPIPPLRVSGATDLSGHSAGLGAALATAWLYFGRSSDVKVAATGCVTPSGDVVGVDHIAEKLVALVREAPHVRRVFVPEQNADDIPQHVAEHVHVVPVSSVSEALDALFASAAWPTLEALDCNAAANLAVEHESHRRHCAAVALAERVIDAADSPDVSEVERPSIKAKARSVLAINCCHAGAAKDAIAELEKLDAEIADELRNEIGSTVASIVEIKRAAALIDLLRPADALRTLAKVPRDIDGQQPKIELYGTLSRAHLLAGDVRAASEASEKQRRYANGPALLHQRCQINCNFIAILLEEHRQAERCGSHDNARRIRAHIRSEITATRAINRSLPDGAARQQNDAYLDLWETRYFSAMRDGMSAVACAGPVPKLHDDPVLRQFPHVYKQRFAAEAMWRSGQTERALSILDETDRVIAPRGEFERLILSTIASRAASIRARNGAPTSEWKTNSLEFFERLIAWAPGIVETLQPWPDGFNGAPKRGASPIAHADALDAVLARLPY